MRRLSALSVALLLALAGCAFEVVEVAPGHHVVRPWQPTAGPTEPPTVTPTPSATLTPTPSQTPSQTPTPETDPTPTPETGLTPTPGSGADKVCLATTGAAINLRADHSTSATILDNVDPGTRMTVLRIWVVQDVTNEWLLVRVRGRSGVTREGWIFRGSTVFLGVDDTEELCWEVPLDGPGAVPTPAPTATPVPGPTWTPVPTGPAPTQCAYVHPTATMSIRSTWSTSGTRLGLLPPNTRVVVGHIFPDRNDNRWAFIEYNGITGWVAVDIGTIHYGDLVGDCSRVPRNQPTVSYNTAVGVRTVPGAVGFEEMYPVLAGKGIPYGVSPYASLNYCVDALENGGICVFRPGFPDCPEPRGVGSAIESALDFMRHAEHAANVLAPYASTGRVWIEPINECMHTPMSGELLGWWGTWMDTYIDEAAARGWPPLALPGLPPGHGDEHMFSVWRPVLLSLKANGGLFSMHDYTFNSRTNLCICDEWEACRHVRNHSLMLRQGYEIGFTITEAARWAGEAPVDVADMACWVNRVRSEHPFVHSVWLWIGGHHPAWPLANLDGHYVAIAERVH